MDGVAMEVGGDVAAAAGTLAGLLLVYVGSLSNSFGAFEPQERRSVLVSYQRRAWFAISGFVLLLISIALAILGKRLNIGLMVDSASLLLFFGLVGVLATGILTVMEIR